MTEKQSSPFQSFEIGRFIFRRPAVLIEVSRGFPQSPERNTGIIAQNDTWPIRSRSTALHYYHHLLKFEHLKKAALNKVKRKVSTMVMTDTG
jgi:hypothetical protein